MAKNTNDELSDDELKSIKSIISGYFSSGNPVDVKQAIALCNEYSIDSKQFELYYKPEEDKPCSHENSNGETLQSPIKDARDDKLVNSIKGDKIPLYNSFPYKERELLTLSKPSLVNIINGCFSSYSSRELMRVFNPKEFLGKMAGIVDLKKQTTYLQKIKLNISAGEVDVDEVFENMIAYLDHNAYKFNSWAKQAEHIKDIYSVAKNEQKNRIYHIPELDKMLFIESIFSKPIDSVSNHNYIHGNNFNKLLAPGTKTGYVAFLMSQLNAKWNNLDNVK